VLNCTALHACNNETEDTEVEMKVDPSSVHLQHKTCSACIAC